MGAFDVGTSSLPVRMLHAQQLDPGLKSMWIDNWALHSKPAFKTKMDSFTPNEKQKDLWTLKQYGPNEDETYLVCFDMVCCL